MKRTRSVALALSLLLSAFPPLAAQQPQGQPPPDDGEEVVARITTNLVQLDAVVLDKEGRQVTDLTADDFEILEDGRAQKITNFSYVSNAERAPRPEKTPAAAAGSPPPPPVKLRLRDVRRTFALVVDDLQASFASIYYIRRALKKFVDEEMQPNDLVAIVRVGAGVGALQQFTSDKRILYQAIERVRFNLRARRFTGPFEPVTSREPTGSPGSLGSPKDLSEEVGVKEGEDEDDYLEASGAVGTLGAVKYVLRGMRELPGRKALLLFSEGFPLYRPNAAGGRNERVRDEYHHMIDAASRSATAVYTMDPRGVVVTDFTAEDDLAGMARNPQAMTSLLMRRNTLVADTQSTLRGIAEETGGIAFINNNDLNAGVRRVAEAERGYYLIGYRPEESTFDRKTGQRRFHNISVKVTRPGLVVRTRSGFFGVTEDDARPSQRTAAQQLMAAITSPFESGAVDLRLTSIFLADPQFGPFMRSFIHVDGGSLSFQEQPDGSHRASVDVLAMTFDDAGTPVDMRSRTESVVVRGDEYRRAVEQGLIFGINLPVKKPGAFQLRIAVRDAGSGRVGSANQFIEVPDVKKERLTLSGIYLAEREEAANVSASAGAGAADEASKADAGGEGKIEGRDPQSGPAVRRFRPGALVEYGYEVYNARLDKATRRPQLQSQVRLFRDNRLAFAGKVVNLSGKADAARLTAFGRLRLGANLTPGEYVLQVVVTDTLAKEKNRVTAQWIDFEIK